MHWYVFGGRWIRAQSMAASWPEKTTPPTVIPPPFISWRMESSRPLTAAACAGRLPHLTNKAVDGVHNGQYRVFEGLPIRLHLPKLPPEPIHCGRGTRRYAPLAQLCSQCRCFCLGCRCLGLGVLDVGRGGGEALCQKLVFIIELD